ncbi:hypothetical protein GBK02_06890 [Dechloromonas sp. TW-R-39-2]|uniref:hypothetical protein n=1 Tax=Dechloromonas sp. TW-R-39-2 TaxID=2654218 RepID=UPI00193D149B|nr:hypothetical protein [Dechloromonas sp. TW-R-39-2]QRM19136.1 hypothetical protein GBK02_06890 [Dechloromonas sp. TW-R-39-2]
MPLVIDPQANAATFGTATHHFGRRWEATFIALLASPAAARQPLSHETLTGELARRGQNRPLNRSQMQRLLDSLRAYLDTLPGQPLAIEHPPRKATTGPWQLHYRQPLAIVVSAADGGRVQAATEPPSPHLLETDCPVTCRQLLEIMMVADGFAAHGKYIEAIESLTPAKVLPITPDFRCLVQLRAIRHENLLGNHAEAHRLLVSLLQSPPSPLADPGLLPYARFQLDRIDYDRSPGRHYHRLWTMGEPLAPRLGVDPLHAGEWHNLRALLARRMLHENAASTGRPDEHGLALHRAALGHLQSALYWMLSQRNWERLQAFAANYAFHLQSVIPYGLATPLETYAWHSLEHAYYDKLDAGKESAWELIFLGQFWLDYETELADATPPTAILDNHHPGEAAFYLHAIRSVEQIGDARQVALGWINYRRFAARHLEQKESLRAERALSGLLTTHGELRATLEAEGYGPNLPPG